MNSGQLLRERTTDGSELMQLDIRGRASGIDGLILRADGGSSRYMFDDKIRPALAGCALPLGFTALRGAVGRVSLRDDAARGRTGANKLGVS